MGNYCHNPDKMYTFLIDEDGEIYKCHFGAWNYANVAEYQDGTFAERFQEFNKTFYGCFVSNCARCLDAYQRNKSRMAKADAKDAQDTAV
jgi:radical SAM protein with 4Fe4S-binding SPASM domain